MRVRQAGGMVEFIPSPQEKRDGLIREYSIELQELLHQRLSRLEDLLQVENPEAQKCEFLFQEITKEERANIALNRTIDKVLNGV